MRRYKVSERRACRLLGQHRSTQRYRPMESFEEQSLVEAMNKLAEAHPRWGYRSMTKLLKDQGWQVNAKRIERLWRLEGHRVPPSKAKKSGQKAIGGPENAARKRPARWVNDVWCYDFVSATVRRGGPIRILNVLDEYSRRSLGSRVARSIGATSVVKHLEKLFEMHGLPRAIRSDNGREFISSTVISFLVAQKVNPIFIEKGKPQQNPFIERFNGTMRRDLLNVEEFNNITEARVLIDAFNLEYNTERPHRGLGMMTPHAFAESRSVVG
ncbi:MAG: IS3 family transposase [Acidimicrobiales bacterium]